MDNLNPVYVVLFCNDGQFSRLIRKATGSQYSHATISLDPSLNEMYSFTDIPYSRARTLLSQPAGLVRESIYGPMYSHNLYFTVLITFVDDVGLAEIKKKIEFFVKNHDKYRYNDLGLVKYFFNIRKKGLPDENAKKKWFCSEFVSYLLKVGGMPGIDTVMKSPQDLYDSDLYVDSVDYTLKSFSEEDLIKKTNAAKAKFIRHEESKDRGLESFNYYKEYRKFYEEDIAIEVALPGRAARERKRVEWSLMDYTTLLDWKYLHEEFIKNFGAMNLDQKFAMIEMIIRKGLKNINKSAVAKYIVKCFATIAKVIVNGSKIVKIDVDRGNVDYIKSGGKRSSISYPEDVTPEPAGVAESFNRFTLV